MATDYKELYKRARSLQHDLAQCLMSSNPLWEKHSTSMEALKKDLDEGMARILLSEMDDIAWKKKCEKVT